MFFMYPPCEKILILISYFAGDMRSRKAAIPSCSVKKKINLGITSIFDSTHFKALDDLSQWIHKN